jgi:hypothetical protein
LPVFFYAIALRGCFVTRSGWEECGAIVPDLPFTDRQKKALLTALGRLAKHEAVEVFLKRAQSVMESLAESGDSEPTNKDLRNSVESLGAAAKGLNDAVSALERSGHWRRLDPYMLELTFLEKYRSQHRIPSRFYKQAGEDAFPVLGEYLHLLESFSKHALDRLPMPSNINKPSESADVAAIEQLAGAYRELFNKNPSGSKGAVFCKVAQVLFPVGNEFVSGVLKRSKQAREWPAKNVTGLPAD